MTTPPGRGEPPAPAHPNWRDQPADLDQLCQLGAELLHGPAVTARDVETITPTGSYL